MQLEWKKGIGRWGKSATAEGQENTKKKTKNKRHKIKRVAETGERLTQSVVKKRIIKCLPHLDTPRKKTPKKKTKSEAEERERLP